MEDSSGNSSGSTIVPEDNKPGPSKEKITSKTNVLGDTGSQWSELTSNEGTSLATTAKTKGATSIQSATPLRIAIEKGLSARKDQKIDLESKTKLPTGQTDDTKSVRSLRESLKSRAQSRADTESLPASTLVPSDDESLNDAVLMDRTLDEIQGLAMPRPKDVLLGK